jgi:hypothetical protein
MEDYCKVVVLPCLWYPAAEVAVIQIALAMWPQEHCMRLVYALFSCVALLLVPCCRSGSYPDCIGHVATGALHEVGLCFVQSLTLLGFQCPTRY